MAQVHNMHKFWGTVFKQLLNGDINHTLYNMDKIVLPYNMTMYTTKFIYNYSMCIYLLQFRC